MYAMDGWVPPRGPLVADRMEGRRTSWSLWGLNLVMFSWSCYLEGGTGSDMAAELGGFFCGLDPGGGGGG